MVTRKNDEAVSPVIGVILMVAITVILAAVIAAFVFGMSGNISKTKTVAITAQKVDSGNITIMNNGGQDGAILIALNATTSPRCNRLLLEALTGLLDMYGFRESRTSWNTMRLLLTSDVHMQAETQVIVVGTFNDGSSQVLLDTYI